MNNPLTRKPEPSEKRDCRIIVRLTKAEAARLEELAASKSNAQKTWTAEECLIRMVQTCQPGGSGWTHPSEKKPSPPEEPAVEKT